LEQAAESASGRPAALLEKDVWVVWAIDRMFRSEFGKSLVFKGGTSLSKAHRIIRRFSEDVDLTYDIRSLAPDLTPGGKVLPDNPSQEKKWTRLLRDRLAEWVATDVMTHLGDSLERERLRARLDVTGEKIRLTYEPVIAAGGYVSQAVLLEFGGRSTGEPCNVIPIACDAARWLPEVAFPTAEPRVMYAERTFWEKATAIHVFCMKGRFAGTDRYSRHWHDLARLDDAGVVERALADGALASEVAAHKSAFFAEKDSKGDRIDYRAAVSGSLRLVPEGQPRVDLAADYELMLDAGLLVEDAETFDVLIDRCGSIERRANET
ncbi:MAG: nucleotidyl transferase AbiEii/AbiGii toxin family protein, partial [Blastocatellia bacterium]